MAAIAVASPGVDPRDTAGLVGGPALGRSSAPARGGI